MQGDLDPASWDDFRTNAHELLDAAIDRLETAEEGGVWTPVAEFIKSRLDDDLPLIGQGPASVATNLAEMLPYGVGNTHPRFFGWVHGAGSPGGLLAEIAAAAMNVNAGGKDHLSPIVERQVIRWSAELMGMNADASGLIVSGTSMATITALKVARDKAVKDARSSGFNQGQLVGYTSQQAHGCVARAFDLLGLGTDNLRLIPCNSAFEMDAGALEQAILADRDAGRTPFVIVGTAGTVNTGAIDPLAALAKIAQDENIWFHVDGAFGAALMLSQTHKQRLSGIEAADSIAFDFHKWFQVNYEAGAVLFKDAAGHKASFEQTADYTKSAHTSFQGGAFWANDFGPELSRGFRALKIWAHFLEHGTEALGLTIDRNIELAAYLAQKIEAAPKLEILAPVCAQICCFRFIGGNDLDNLNQALVARLQDSAIAVPSSTMINGQFAIRVNITNHRTSQADIDILIDAVETMGAELAG